MLLGKLQDSLSDGVSKASRLMSRSVSSGEGDRAAAENSSDLRLRSIESDLDSVRLSAGATRRFFLTGCPESARLLGGAGPQPITQAQSHALYVCIIQVICSAVKGGSLAGASVFFLKRLFLVVKHIRSPSFSVF